MRNIFCSINVIFLYLLIIRIRLSYRSLLLLGMRKNKKINYVRNNNSSNQASHQPGNELGSVSCVTNALITKVSDELLFISISL